MGGRSPPLSQDVYIWQRDWNEAVCEALVEHGSNFESVVVLKAEVSWQKRKPQIHQIPLDYALLKKSSVHAGMTLRIGPYPGPFLPDDKTTTLLADMTAAIVAEAKAKGCAPGELQIDFDCAESKLDGYRVWVETIRRKISPVPLIITALPSWLAEPSFAKLAAASDGYVLQVHSLEAPRSANAPFTLCDPKAAQQAVELAGRFPTPFRVALPTYGYVIAFNHSGKFLGLSAEGPRPNWPADSQLREVRTDPLAMAQLVHFWTTNHPSAMRGIIWYRLPVEGDFLNLHWPTLATMMSGRPPREHVQAAERRVEPRLLEISLVNDGELDFSSRLAVEVRWQNARLVAGDGIDGFNLVDDGSSAVRFQMDNATFRLPAGEKQIIG